MRPPPTGHIRNNRGVNLSCSRSAKYSRLQSGGWGGATLGAGRHVSLHPPPIPLVYTANLIGVDLSMCIPLCKILSNWFGHKVQINVFMRSSMFPCLYLNKIFEHILILLQFLKASILYKCPWHQILQIYMDLCIHPLIVCACSNLCTGWI